MLKAVFEVITDAPISAVKIDSKIDFHVPRETSLARARLILYNTQWHILKPGEEFAAGTNRPGGKRNKSSVRKGG